jgi:hypothetical protein
LYGAGISVDKSIIIPMTNKYYDVLKIF